MTIRASLRDTEITLLIAVSLVTLVVFLFLGNFRATLAPSIAVIVSIVGTFGAMYLLGYSLNMLSLMALTIATGFVVDDAIVVVENIDRHIEAGMDAGRSGAARRAGSRLYRAVHHPVADRGVHAHPVHGRDHRALLPRIRHDPPVAILISLVISLTTTPMLCALVMRRQDPAEQDGARLEPVPENSSSACIPAMDTACPGRCAIRFSSCWCWP